ncbi:MAG: potassium uptake protein, TrkH family [Lachnospiraceae bacterium]|nr:potassium uptake protein, TrkH family [Lachnospiraceae bacterium]
MGIGFSKKRIILNLYQIITLTFLLIIFVGAVLLTLPFASKTFVSCGFLTALFTAASAVCVTGLSVVDVWTQFSLFGQIVLIALVQIGGIGFMSIITILFHLTNHKESIQSLSLSAESLGLDDIGHIKRIQKRLILGTFFFESIGALVLFFCFIPSMGILNALWFGIFHSVSAFCNAGFDLMGYFSPGVGLTYFNNKPAVLLTVSLLIVIGGIGFMVWDDVYTSKGPRNWTIYTKIVLSVTASLIVLGTVFFFITEFRNNETIGSMSFGNKLVNSLFQSVTTRTAGFASVDQGSLKDSSVAMTSILMMIGGSAGSTAGGVKTATFLILVKTLLSHLRGRKHVILMQRTITDDQILYAFTVTAGFALISTAGAFLVSFASNMNFLPAYFESISALATVGLSLGITSSLSAVSRVIIIILMYLGRVGLLTLTLGFFKAKEDLAIKYPTTNIIIG